MPAPTKDVKAKMTKIKQLLLRGEIKDDEVALIRGIVSQARWAIKNQKNYLERSQNEKSVKEDMVIFDYEAKIEGKNFEGGQGKSIQIVLGRDLFIKGFDNQLVGVKKNQNKY